MLKRDDIADDFDAFPNGEAKRILGQPVRAPYVSPVLTRLGGVAELTAQLSPSQKAADKVENFGHPDGFRF
ncbi:MAG: hypothetical protein HYU52_17855 [Acidobacteria bacterium]|nr:hypothetical protein [Acidobacteriota bacterium]